MRDLQLGVSAFSHDSTAAVAAPEGLLSVVEEERLTRVKHDAQFPTQAIASALRCCSATTHDIDRLWYFERPLRKVARLERLARGKAAGDNAYRQVASERTSRYFEEWQNVESWANSALRRTDVVAYIPHQLSHAASAFFTSPFDNAAIVTADAFGEETTAAIFDARGVDIHVAGSVLYPHSLGLFYALITAFLGFRVNADEYKVMGLAPYGKPRFDSQLRNILRFPETAPFSLDTTWASPLAVIADLHAPRLVRLLGKPRQNGEPISERHADIAASAQLLVEEGMLRLVKMARKLLPGARKLCLAGGVLLNCVANRRIFESGIFDDVYIPPVQGDTGGAVGAALWGATRQTGRRPDIPFSPYQGPSYTTHEIEQELKAQGVSFRTLPQEAIYERVAALLAKGKIVGWFSGRMECGPRALGGRSILADPSHVAVRDQLNSVVKQREAYRPFAPVVLYHRAHEFFELPVELPYMTVTVRVRQKMRNRIPAVVHVDGSARVQTLTSTQHPSLHRLLSAFERITGLPVLLNTSFNTNEEPIVASPKDAIGCFLRSGLDVLVCENCLVVRPELSHGS